MKVHQLNLANFRGFAQIDLTFAPDVTVIAGVNGVGKSSILQALAILFSRVLPTFTASTSKPLSFTDEDVAYGKPTLEAAAIFTVANQQCHMGVQRVLADGEAGDQFYDFWQTNATIEPVTTATAFADLLATRTLTGNLEAGRLATERMLRSLQEAPNQPQVIYFSTKRQLPGRPRTLPTLQPFELANAYPFALQDREVDLREFMHWFRVVESGIGHYGQKGAEILDHLRTAVTSFVPAFTNLRVEETPSLRFVVEKAGVPLALQQLSDGERGLLAMLFDITRRLAIANPQRENPIAQGEAIILIDEIELHLHPEWQRQVLRRLQQVFQRCQFIVTTHSPQVIGEVESRSLRLLLHEDDRVIAWTPPRSFGLDSSRVLEELMDVKARNAEVDAALQELFQRIDDEDFDTARALINQLAQKLSEDDPELTRARTLITFLEDGE